MQVLTRNKGIVGSAPRAVYEFCIKQNTGKNTKPVLGKAITVLLFKASCIVGGDLGTQILKWKQAPPG